MATLIVNAEDEGSITSAIEADYMRARLHLIVARASATGLSVRRTRREPESHLTLLFIDGEADKIAVFCEGLYVISGIGNFTVIGSTNELDLLEVSVGEADGRVALFNMDGPLL